MSLHQQERPAATQYAATGRSYLYTDNLSEPITKTKL